MGLCLNTVVVACAGGSTLGGIVAGFRRGEQLSGASSGHPAGAKGKRMLIVIDAYANLGTQQHRQSCILLARRLNS